MNANDDGSLAERNPPLSGFYAYKNSFNNKTIWVDIPKELTFFNTLNPYTDPGTPGADGRISHSQTSDTPKRQDYWSVDHQLRDGPSELHNHGLEALSTAALFSPLEANMNPRVVSLQAREFDIGYNTGTPNREHAGPPISPPTPLSSTNTLNYILNPDPAVDSPIDPSLMSPPEQPITLSTKGASTFQKSKKVVRPSGEVESEQKGAFLLRHFSESPGQWMDLFDLSSYFGSYVPVQARSHPLLKHAACAYAAKQLGRVKGAKAVHGGISSRQASMELYNDPSIDWEWEGASHYDKSIYLLMEAIRQDQEEAGVGGNGAREPPWELPCADGVEDGEHTSHDHATARLRSDEVVAATAILCVYEFLSATGSAWSRHLNGTKSLLDIAEGSMMPLDSPNHDLSLLSPRRTPSQARRATFWNFARQDYLAAFINECQTRLDTGDLQMWREAGLLLTDAGLVVASNTTQSGMPEGVLMKEDMISNSLVWLSSRLCNFIAAGEGLNPIPAGDRSENDQIEEPGNFGKTQKSLLDQWYAFQHEFDLWFSGLPPTFKPSARLHPARQFFVHQNETYDCPFDEIWFALPMCASTMQHYHMARILLYINKPHETTARRITIGGRLNSYRYIDGQILHHCYEICGIALSRPPAGARVHSTQPLFVAGQCLNKDRERQVVLDLLRDIEQDLGWATEGRVQQLLKEWGWSESGLVDM